jgi:hypothetical protein
MVFVMLDIVLLLVFIAVTVAALKDARLAKAAGKGEAERAGAPKITNGAKHAPRVI